MTESQNEDYANLIDCGDGVPTLSFNRTGETGEAGPDHIRGLDDGGVDTMEAINQVVDAFPDIPTMGARTAAVLATIIGQVAIGLAVVFGADPIVGGAAAVAVMLTGIGLAIGAAIGAGR